MSIVFFTAKGYENAGPPLKELGALGFKVPSDSSLSRINALLENGPAWWREQLSGRVGGVEKGSFGAADGIFAILAEGCTARCCKPTGEGRKAGGRCQPTTPAASLITPILARPAGSPLDDVGAEVEECIEEYLKLGVTEGTARAYQRGWEKWLWWVKRHEWATPYLMGETRKERAEDEVRLLSFLGYLIWMRASSSGVRQCLFAIQGAHKRAGAGDPLTQTPRVWLLLVALKKTSPPAPRKLGVTIEMLEWLRGSLKPAWPVGNRSTTEVEAKVDDTVRYCAIVFGWFYLCRAGEYVRSGLFDPDKVLRGMDVKLQKEGKTWRADVQFRKTKADQQAFGCVRTHYSIADLPKTGVCVVEALRMLQAWKPERFGRGSEAHLPLFRLSSGRLMQREQIQVLLQLSAIAVGLPAGRFKSHSLRIGGASAMLHSTGEFALVKRFGRWSSDAVHTYLHDSAAQSVGLAAAMSRDRSSVHYT